MIPGMNWKSLYLIIFGFNYKWNKIGHLHKLFFLSLFWFNKWFVASVEGYIGGAHDMFVGLFFENLVFLILENIKSM